MGRNEVVVTGVGPVSAIGIGRNEFWEALVAGRHGFRRISLCDASRSPSKIAAEIPDFRLERFVTEGDLMARRTPRPVQLALAAAVLALHDSGIDLDDCDPDRLGVHVGTSVGNLETILQLNSRYQQTGSAPPYTSFHAFNHSAACLLSSFFNIRGPIHTTTSGCNSGIDALGQSLRMIQAGAADAMLVVGTDCEVVPEVIAALNASNSLTTRYNDAPERASRPFDLGRDGNVIGEGAAALLLESESHALARGARIYARLGGYQICSAGQNRQYSHDRPEIDTRPAVRAIGIAIGESGLLPEMIGLVNANGSSSVIYDRLEAQAFAEVFGESLPDIPIHSIKSMLGQHGAGSSALQAVTACLSIQCEAAPPTINHEDPDPSCGNIRVVVRASEFPRRPVLVHSIGLGGFYYSAAVFLPPDGKTGNTNEAHQVQWSKKAHPRFQPAEEFQRPLTPLSPRHD
ncbi:MAG TPA: beta-ketoacyl-[acyl-carrier-protein] synthase family protein [Bacteroidota bacterium]|nr:beta-ketoacyl-[acyl-carrier-protein] synthase family protein [Bacteroidota bacterium]